MAHKLVAVDKRIGATLEYDTTRGRWGWRMWTTLGHTDEGTAWTERRARRQVGRSIATAEARLAVLDRFEADT